jgi:hypothetical protein
LNAALVAFGEICAANQDRTHKYWAQQNAIQNTSNFIDQQYQIKQVINEGYLKLK